MVEERAGLVTARSQYDRCVPCEIASLHLEDDGESITWALVHDLRYLEIPDRLPFARYTAEFWAVNGLRIAEPTTIVDWACVFEYTGIRQCRWRRTRTRRAAAG